MTTVPHDSHNITVFGEGPDDMAVAESALRDTQWRLVVVVNGKVLTKLMLPILDLISERPLAEVAKEFADVCAALDTLVVWGSPYLVFKVLFGGALVCNAGPRLRYGTFRCAYGEGS